MNETQWSESGAEPAPKKSLPKWLWFCGGGCLLAVILSGVGAFACYKMAEKIADPEYGWAQLQKALPADQEHPDHTAHAAPSWIPGAPITVIVDSLNLQLQFQVHTGASGKQAREQLFEGDSPVFPENVIVMKFTDMTKGTVEVQGRELKVLRLKGEIAGFMRSMAGEEGAKQADQYMVMIDVTPEGETERFVMCQVQRPVSQGELTDELINEALKPFHIGPKR